MIAKDLLRALRAYKGPVFVEVSNGTDVHVVQAVKSDLLAFINGNFLPDEQTGYTLSGDTFGRDYT